jgi:hypothetical protein
MPYRSSPQQLRYPIVPRGTKLLRIHPQRMAVAFALALVLATGAVVGRSLAAPAVLPPPMGDVRHEPNMLTLPARSPLSPAELAKTVDAVGIIHVDGVKGVKDHSRISTTTGIETSWGHADVTATVSVAILGDSNKLSKFAFDCWFLAGTTELATPVVNPPLEVGADYLVFIQNGKLAYPDGAYRVSGDRVWNIGQWESADSREYPADLSGKTISEAKQVLQAALTK